MALRCPEMDLGLHGKVALVTAASQGIGFGIARELAREGARVAICSRSQERIDAAVREIQTAAADGAIGEIERRAAADALSEEPVGDAPAGEPGVRGYVHDTADLDAAPALVEAVARDLGPIDILVTNTGSPAGGNPIEFTREQWEVAHRDLVIAAIEMIELVVPGMRERGFGRVVSVSSSAAKEPITGLMMSSAHRPGLLGAFKLLSRELSSSGITFNTILPGRIATDRMADLHGSIDEAEEEARTEVPAGRLGTLDEIGAAAAFLCSERASYITGTYLLVDGGLTKSL
jgi:3-oxoacyl-[acyl-carrier protein] reductase